MLSWHCVANLRDAQELATKLKRDLKYIGLHMGANG
jgi:hypothetical protein